MNRFRVGDWVVAMAPVGETYQGELILYALPGQFGRVIELSEGCLPTVRWSDSNMVYDCHPDEMCLAAQIPEPSAPSRRPRLPSRSA